MPDASARLEVPAEPLAFFEEMERRGWGDGLPVIPPTPEHVEAFVAASGRPAEEVVGDLAPNAVGATVEKIAANAVMAGCRAAYMPVLVAAVKGVADPAFNLLAVQPTTHPCGVLVLVHGPIARALEMNAGYGAFGPGNRANATIGRALRLVLLNIGGGRPGLLDRATQGSPAKYTFCVAENEADCPWPSLRESLGFQATDSVVTVHAGEAPHNVNDHGSFTPESLVHQLASAMAAPGSNQVYMRSDTFVFLGPEHAHQLADAGYTRESLQLALFDGSRIPPERFGPGQLRHIRDNLTPEDLALAAEGIPPAREPADIRLTVVGDRGRHSCWVPGFGFSRSSSVLVA